MRALVRKLSSVVLHVDVQIGLGTVGLATAFFSAMESLTVRFVSLFVLSSIATVVEDLSKLDKEDNISDCIGDCVAIL